MREGPTPTSLQFESISGSPITLRNLERIICKTEFLGSQTFCFENSLPVVQRKECGTRSSWPKLVRVRPSPLAVQIQNEEQESIKLFAPALIILEVSNVFCKRVRRGEMSVTRAMEAYRLLKINAPILVDDRDLMEEAVTLALAAAKRCTIVWT